MPAQADFNVSQGQPWDLRSFYAINILGAHLLDIAVKRKQNNLLGWYNALIDLEIVISHKLKKEHIEELEKFKKERLKKLDTYKQILATNDTMNSHFAEVKTTLIEYEKLLYKLIEETGLFGAKQDWLKMV